MLLKKNQKELIIINIFILLSINYCYSQNIDKYIFLHSDKKNDSQFKSSPLYSGYNKNKSVETNFKSIPTESMKKKVKFFLDNIDLESNNNLENATTNNIQDSIFLENQRNILNELDNEASEIISQQHIEDKKKDLQLRKANLASYTAKIARKKQEIEEKQTIEETILPDYSTTKEIPQNVIISTDKDGKLKIDTKTASPEENNEHNLSSETQSTTKEPKNTSINSATIQSQ